MLQSHRKNVSQKLPILENLLEILRFPSPISRFPSPILRFPSPKIQFSSHEIRFPPISFLLSSTAFRFLQRLSAFFNGFPTFFNGFPIFLNGFPLSEKSDKIYLWRQVYEKTLFELRIFRHLLPELCNSRYIVYISPTNSPQTHENAQVLPGKTRASDDRQPPGGMPRKNRERVPRTAPHQKKFLRCSFLEPHPLIPTHP
jgi:hypothetical protein